MKIAGLYEVPNLRNTNTTITTRVRMGRYGGCVGSGGGYCGNTRSLSSHKLELMQNTQKGGEEGEV